MRFPIYSNLFEISNLFDPDLNTPGLCPSLAASLLLIAHQDPLPPNSQVSGLNVATLTQASLAFTPLTFTHSVQHLLSRSQSLRE